MTYSPLMNTSANAFSPQLEFGELVLKKVDVGFEAISRPHLDGKVAAAFGFLRYCVRKASVTFEKLWRERGDRD